jgi:hypothetical protein
MNDEQAADESSAQTGFEPPEHAAQARLRRLNGETGAWEDAQVVYDGVRTPLVPAHAASPDLPLVHPEPSLYRWTWYSDNGKVCGYSRKYKVGGGLEYAGGESNTPRKRPPHTTFDARKISAEASGGALTPAETLLFLRGLAEVAQQTAAPVVQMLQAQSESMLSREREWYREQLELMEQRHRHREEQDRAWYQRVRELEAGPREERVRQLEERLQQLDEPEEEEEEQEGQAGPWDVAAAALEHGPAIVRAVSEEARGWKTTEPSVSRETTGGDDGSSGSEQ